MPRNETPTAEARREGGEYDAYYFEHYGAGMAYGRHGYWLEFFGRIADRIIEDMAPTTVLDAGCAMGLLVEALRDRGVEAYGLDVSEYALGEVREDVRDYCWRASITEPLEREFDLIVCLEVLEHLMPEESLAAIDNICAHTSEVLFSSTPAHFEEPTHQNVRPTSYWVSEFARRGLVSDAAYDASYVVDWARRFRQKGLGIAQAFAAYEQELIRLDDENRALRGELVRRSDQVAQQETTLTQVHEDLAQKDAALTHVGDELAHARNELQQARAETATLRDDAQARIAAAESELVAMTETLTFRATQRPRAVYGRLRRWRKDRRGASSDARPTAPFEVVREELASRWIRGRGIEIGALHQPLNVPNTATVTYVDRMTVASLREHYPELASYELVEPDVIDDGEYLATLADASHDFVIANHFIEHCEDPIRALRTAIRVLRPGGVLYLAVPDKRQIFDRDRPLTTIEHLERDHRDGPAWSRADHYQEWARLVVQATDVRANADDLMARGYSIHFHVWTAESFSAFLEHCRRSHGLDFDIAAFIENDFEFVAVLTKANGTSEAG